MRSLSFFLPPHQRCAKHTLNLAATMEVDKPASKGHSRKVYQSTMEICASIWNKAHRSTVGVQAVQDVENMRVSVPCITRWNSEYEAISKLIGFRDDQLTDICGKLGVTGLYPHEVTFLRVCGCFPIN